MVIFTNTSECRANGNAYLANNRGRFLDAAVTKSQQLKEAVLGIRERRAKTESEVIFSSDMTSSTMLPSDTTVLHAKDRTVATNDVSGFQQSAVLRGSDEVMMIQPGFDRSVVRSKPVNDTQATEEVGRRKSTRFSCFPRAFFSCACPCAKTSSPVHDISSPVKRPTVNTADTLDVLNARDPTPASSKAGDSIRKYSL